MTKEVANKAAGALAAFAGLKAGLANVQAAIPRAGGEPIMRLGRDGVWLYGADNIDVQDGSEWALNPLSLEHGLVCWKKIPEGSKEAPELLGSVLVPMTQPMPNKANMQDFGHPWTECVSIGMKCVTGDDAGTQIVYKPNSVGGLNAMREIVGQIMAQLDKDPEHPCPVVALESDSYPHKRYGKIYVPVLRITRWVSMDGIAPDAAENGAAEPEQEADAPAPAPAATSRRRPPVSGAAAQAPTPPAEAAAPSGQATRRRRPAATK